MTNKRAPEGRAAAGITCQLIPPQRREKLPLRQAAGAGPRRRHGRDGKEERNFRLARRPQRTTASHWRWQAHPPLFSTSIVVFHASVLWLLPLYLPHTWPPTRCTKCRLACLRLHRFLLAPRPGRHPPLAILWSIVSQRPASRITTPQQRRVRVYTGAAPAAPPRRLAQPWSKGTWRIGIGDRPSRDKERPKHTLFRTLSRL